MHTIILSEDEFPFIRPLITKIFEANLRSQVRLGEAGYRMVLGSPGCDSPVRERGETYWEKTFKLSTHKIDFK